MVQILVVVLVVLATKTVLYECSGSRVDSIGDQNSGGTNAGSGIGSTGNLNSVGTKVGSVDSTGNLNGVGMNAGSAVGSIAVFELVFCNRLPEYMLYEENSLKLGCPQRTKEGKNFSGSRATH